MSSLRSLALCAVLSGIPAVLIAADGPVINEIRVEGAVRTEPDRIRMRMVLQPGDKLDAKILGDDVRAIRSMRAFTSVTHVIVPRADGRADLVITVQEPAILGRVSIEGAGWWHTSSVEDLLTTRTGQAFDPIALESDRKAIESYFRTQGCLQAKVDLVLKNARSLSASAAVLTPFPAPISEQTPNADGITDILFRIDRGFQVQVERVQYQGLPDAIPSQLADALLTNRPGAPYSPEMLELDHAGLARFLRDRGYLEARVVSRKVDFFDAVGVYDERFRTGPSIVPEGLRNDRVVLVFSILPGPLYHLGTVAFTGVSKVSEEELRTAFALPTGTDFRRPWLDQAIRRAVRPIQNQGHAKLTWNEDARYDHEKRIVDLTFNITEGPVYHVDRIDPKGNTVTRDQVIRREVTLTPGQLWNEDEREESEMRVMRTGLFKPNPNRAQIITPLYDDARPGLTDVEIAIEEDDTASLMASAGWSSGSGLMFSGQFTEGNFDTFGLFSTGQFRHFRGAGHILKIYGSYSQDRTSAGVSWTNPRVMDGPWALTLGANRSDSSQIDWDEVRQTGSIDVSRSFWRDHFRLGMGVAYSDLKVREPDADASDEVLLNVPGNYHVGMTNISQIIDQRDHPTIPTRGWKLEFTESAAGLVLDASHPYWSVRGVGECYFPLTQSELGGTTVLKLRHQQRYLQQFDADKAVPFYDRIYGGGPSPAFRGYGFGDMGPREVNANGFSARLGGTHDWVSTAEILIPLQGTRDGFYGVLFSDVGQVWGGGLSKAARHEREAGLQNLLTNNVIDQNTYRTLLAQDGDTPFDLGDLKVAAGFGLRFPKFFPISLDFAFLLNGNQGDKGTQFHFSMFRQW